MTDKESFAAMMAPVVQGQGGQPYAIGIYVEGVSNRQGRSPLTNEVATALRSAGYEYIPNDDSMRKRILYRTEDCKREAAFLTSIGGTVDRTSTRVWAAENAVANAMLRDAR